MSEEQTDAVTAIAVEMGYNPDYEGDGKKTAEEFIKRGAKIQKTQSEKIKDLMGRMDGMSSSFEKMQGTFNETLTAQETKHKQDLERQKTDIEAKIVTAVDEADITEVNRLRKEKDAIEKEVSKPPAPEVSKEQQYFDNWHDDKKSWLKKGSVAEAEMMVAIKAYREKAGGNPDLLLDVKDELKAAEDHLKKKYPEKFGLNPEEKPPGGAVGEGKQKGNTVKTLRVSDLNAEEKKHFTNIKRLLRDKFDEKTQLQNILNARIALGS